MFVDDLAERAIVGFALRNPELAGARLSKVRRTVFYRESHRVIWEAVLANIAAPTLTNVRHTLGDSADVAGGVGYLRDIAEAAPDSWHHVETALDTVRRLAALRRVVQVGRGLAGLGADADPMQAAQTAIEALSEADGSDAQWSTLMDLGDRLVERQAEAEQRRAEGGDTYYRTGIGFLDGGHMHCHLLLAPGKQLVIAGRPTTGKSSLARQILWGLVRHQPTMRAALQTLEMSDDDQGDAFYGTISGVPSNRLLEALSKPERDAIDRARGLAETARIFIKTPDEFKPAQVLAEAEYAIRVQGCAVIAVDYIGLIDTPLTSSRQQALGAVSKGFKRLANQYKVLSIIAAQLNRQVEARGGEPRMSDLRECGDLEQDADAIVLTHAPRNEAGDVDPTRRTLICCKQRGGTTWKRDVHFDGPRTRFAEISDR